MIATETAAETVTLKGLSVLVVEDESIVSLMVENMLTELGCAEIWYASGVSEALEILAERIPDAAVLDVNLAGEQAYPIASRLAAEAVPFIFATGYGASGINREWHTRPVIQKPFHSDTLASALTRAMQAAARADRNREGR
jgi:CheY-like chemotaxis protein